MKRATAAKATAPRIHYIPTDFARAELERDEKPLPPPKGSATVTLGPKVRPGLYEPQVEGFRYWETEQALMYGLYNWRELTGRPLEAWQGRRKSLPVLLDVGSDLNANYDRAELNFYHFNLPGRTVFTCLSPDVVCHEQGHAILDSLRPDFWGAPWFEIGAFHESFGDCLAMLVGLNDLEVCKAVLRAGGLDQPNLVSDLAADLAIAIGNELGRPELVDSPAPHPALRRALNDWRYQDPSTLPALSPANRLCAEVHNFSRVFTGCFYDVLRNLFASQPTQNAQRLQLMAHLAGELLVAAVETAPLVPHFYAAVAQRLLQADAQLHAGVHATEIRAAFARHGIGLAPPRKSLAIPVMPAKAKLSRAAAGERLLAFFGVEPSVDGVEFTPVRSKMHGEIAHVAAYRPEDVSDAHPALHGVSALIPAATRVQVEGASVVGVLGDLGGITDESVRAAKAFVRSLVETGNLEGVRHEVQGPRRPGPATHAIREVGGRKTVVRLRFAC